MAGLYTLTDTVGFIRHLPHDLVEAFASTLEESTYADLLVHVVDGSDPDPIGQINAVRAVLADIGAAEIPELIVINKVDRAAAETLRVLHASYPDAAFISARTGRGTGAVAHHHRVAAAAAGDRDSGAGAVRAR